MKIVVAYDGSEDAKEGIRVAERFLKEEGGELILLTVAVKREDMTKEEVNAQIERAKTILDEAKKSFPGLNFKSELLEDYSVAEAILKYVERIEADLLIMGARGTRPDILRFTLGSTASKVVAFAPCSVFIVRKKPKEE